jgi:hypothetical protein
MDLYSLVGADQHVDSDGTRYVPDPETGAFHFPDEVADQVGGFAVKGRKLWETETDRADRMHGLEMARRRDPATMLSMQEENVALMRKLTELTAQLAASQIGQAAPAPADPVKADEAPAETHVAPDDREPVAATAKPARVAKATAKPA